MADLVWSDPAPNTHFPNQRFTATSEDMRGDFQISPRGAGYLFGKQVTRHFLDVNGLGHICRAHQLCMEGYQILFDDLVSTVWSAPNYCYRAGNLASVLQIGPELDRFFNVFGPCPEDARDMPGKEAQQTGTQGGIFDDDEGPPLVSEEMELRGKNSGKGRGRARGGSGGAAGDGSAVGGLVREFSGDDGNGTSFSNPTVSEYFM
ncbi:UNVERIFIED_CONTAM: putative serine/threonine protein phosphatase [Siphonaria sp. JEL0065]|nr:putative serine/threonine protein phosphatase [Siphonaria sp. JEL0065]